MFADEEENIILLNKIIYIYTFFDIFVFVIFEMFGL